MAHDLRRYARQTNTRLVIGFVILLLVIGDGLIYIFIGRNAAILGLICILAGLAPMLLIVLVLWLIDQIVKVNRPT
jgi:hypothetical protein